jgi:hypothetical protein
MPAGPVLEIANCKMKIVKCKNRTKADKPKR